MSDVVLCVDVGNSHTVIGIYRGETIVEYWRITSPEKSTSDEIFIRASTLIASSSVNAQEITHIGLSSVVPELERIWRKALSKFLRPKVNVVSYKNCLGLKINYDFPAQLGTDRICNAIAMKEMGLKDAIALDLGTATTFDVLRNGEFAGGVILPGIDSSLDVLVDRAVKLPKVTLDWTDSVICHNTEDAIRAGVLYGYLGQLDFVIRKIRNEIGGEEAPVIATGGWSSTLNGKTELVNNFDWQLTLKGVRLIALN